MGSCSTSCIPQMRQTRESKAQDLRYAKALAASYSAGTAKWDLTNITHGAIVGGVDTPAPGGHPFPVSNNSLKTIATCELQSVLKHCYRFVSREEAASLRCGIAVHLAFETFFKTGSPSTSMEAFTTDYQEWSDLNIHPKDRRGFDNVHATLTEWFERFPTLESLPYTVYPDKVELEISVPLDDEGRYLITGRVDAVVESDGHLYVMDHKTAAKIDSFWASQFKNDSQMSGYTWAVAAQLGAPIVGVLINGVQIGKLPSAANRRCAKHNTDYESCGPKHATFELVALGRTPEQLDQWRAGAIKLAKALEVLRQVVQGIPIAELDLDMFLAQGQFNGGCRWCDFREFCEAGKPRRQLKFNYRVRE